MIAPDSASGKPGELLPVASLTTVPLRKSGAFARPQPALLPVVHATAARGLAAAVPAKDEPVRIIAWWEQLKQGRRFPSPEDLDRGAIAAAWPEAVLLDYDATQEAILGATRLSTAGLVPSEIVEYSAMVTEWLLGFGRKAAQLGGALWEEREFPIGRGIARYRIIALPLSSRGRVVDSVLCRLAPA
ncbi:MAG TPA: hypothetical protein VFA50_08500 [Stellaceae bacterium]|nr:hypothetical protein [Stellaceae bacterium]